MVRRFRARKRECLARRSTCSRRRPERAAQTQRSLAATACTRPAVRRYCAAPAHARSARARRGAIAAHPHRSLSLHIAGSRADRACRGADRIALGCAWTHLRADLARSAARRRARARRGQPRAALARAGVPLLPQTRYWFGAFAFPLAAHTAHGAARAGAGACIRRDRTVVPVHLAAPI